MLCPFPSNLYKIPVCIFSLKLVLLIQNKIPQDHNRLTDFFDLHMILSEHIMFPYDFFHPYHIIPMPELISATGKPSRPSITQTGMKNHTVRCEIRILLRRIGNTGIAVANPLSFQIIFQRLIQQASQTASSQRSIYIYRHRNGHTLYGCLMQLHTQIPPPDRHILRPDTDSSACSPASVSETPPHSVPDIQRKPLYAPHNTRISPPTAPHPALLHHGCEIPQVFSSRPPPILTALHLSDSYSAEA